MLVKIRKIGNSQGILLPKYLLSEASMGDVKELSLDCRNGQIILSPPHLSENVSKNEKPTENPIYKEIP